MHISPFTKKKNVFFIQQKIRIEVLKIDNVIKNLKALAQGPYLWGEGKSHKLNVKPKEKKEEFLLRRKFKERQKDLGFLYKGLCRAPKSIRVYGI